MGKHPRSREYERLFMVCGETYLLYRTLVNLKFRRYEFVSTWKEKLRNIVGTLSLHIV